MNLQDLATEVLSVLELDQLKIPGWSDGAELDIKLIPAGLEVGLELSVATNKDKFSLGIIWGVCHLV